jgi:hypothetical protein
MKVFLAAEHGSRIDLALRVQSRHTLRSLVERKFHARCSHPFPQPQMTVNRAKAG